MESEGTTAVIYWVAGGDRMTCSNRMQPKIGRTHWLALLLLFTFISLTGDCFLLAVVNLLSPL